MARPGDLLALQEVAVYFDTVDGLQRDVFVQQAKAVGHGHVCRLSTGERAGRRGRSLQGRRYERLGDRGGRRGRIHQVVPASPTAIRRKVRRRRQGCGHTESGKAHRGRQLGWRWGEGVPLRMSGRMTLGVKRLDLPPQMNAGRSLPRRVGV